MRNLFWILLICLTGCAPLVTLEPPAPPEVVAIQITPALRIYRDEINQCASTHPEIVLIIEERPASALGFGSETLTLSLEYPALEITDYAVLLGMDTIVYSNIYSLLKF